MKRVYIIFILLFILVIHALDLRSQGSAMAEIYSGYGKTLYSMKNYDPSGFVPIGFRAAIGAYGLQFGPDLWTGAKSQKFSFSDSTDNKMFTENIKDTYFGGMVRGFAGDDPQRIAIVFHIGMGLYFSKKITSYSDYFLLAYPNVALNQNYKFKNSIGYDASFGISIPFGLRGFHLTIEAQYNYNRRIENKVKNYYTTMCIMSGISYNFIDIYDPAHYQY